MSDVDTPITPEDPPIAVEPEDAEATSEDAATAPPSTVPLAADAALVEAVGGGLTWVPFALYLFAWVALAVASGYLLGGATVESPARWLPEYPVLLWVGVVLTALGPILSLLVWLVARSRRSAGARRGLFASSMTRGALAAVFGVMIWIGTLYAVEMMNLNGVLG